MGTARPFCDGFGFLIEKQALLMKVFRWSLQRCRSMPGAAGWVWYYWALENDATMFGKLVERKGKGYIGMEADRIFDEAKRNRK
jgi:hypothetical protein